MTRKVSPSIIYISIIHCMCPSICVAAFVTAPHKLPSAYMTFLLRHSGIYIRLLYALMHVVNNEQSTHVNRRLVITVEQVVLSVQCEGG